VLGKFTTPKGNTCNTSLKPKINQLTINILQVLYFVPLPYIVTGQVRWLNKALMPLQPVINVRSDLFPASFVADETIPVNFPTIPRHIAAVMQLGMLQLSLFISVSLR
jgi:hypothetical protein